jgi:outer membrane protein OmpA-like peptidoglycan-associated protein
VGQIFANDGGELLGPHGAVHANGVRAHALQHGDHGSGLRAGQQSSVCAVGVGNENRQPAVFLCGEQGGFCLGKVSHRFDDYEVGAGLRTENDFLPEDVAAINDAIKALQDAIAAKDIDAIKKGTDALNDAVAKARENKKAADEAAAKEAAEKEAAAKAAAEAARAQALADAIEAAKKSSNVVYYVIGKYDIRNQERYKINNLLKKLKANPEAKAVLCSFADKETGTPDGNWVLSENRSNIVSEALQAAGIDPSRIETYWYGDTERISRIPEKNRATVLLCK